MAEEDIPQDLRDALSARVHAVFPDAQPVEAHGMTGWQVRLPDDAPPRQDLGTLDADHLQVFPVRRKAGVTLHVWNPVDYHFLDTQAGLLSDAGFRVMKGCIQWNRKAPLDLDAVEALLQAAKASWA